MEAIRVIKTVKNHQVSINVPKHFEGKDVEVIILSSEMETGGNFRRKDEFLKFLRNGPTFSEEEIQRIDAVKKEFRNWTIEGF
jgi:hypothetical protein